MTTLMNWILDLRYRLALLKYRNPACLFCFKVTPNYRLINPPYGYGKREVRICEDCWRIHGHNYK